MYLQYTVKKCVEIFCKNIFYSKLRILCVLFYTICVHFNHLKYICLILTHNVQYELTYLCEIFKCIKDFVRMSRNMKLEKYLVILSFERNLWVLYVIFIIKRIFQLFNNNSQKSLLMRFLIFIEVKLDQLWFKSSIDYSKLCQTSFE